MTENAIDFLSELWFAISIPLLAAITYKQQLEIIELQKQLRQNSKPDTIESNATSRIYNLSKQP